MLLIAPTTGLAVLRQDSLSCRCVAAPIEELATALTVADQVRVAIPTWRDLPREVVTELRKLDGSITDPLAASAEQVFEALRVRLADLAERLAAHGRHLLLGVLERDESDAPARMLAVLAVMGRTISEIDVIVAC